LVRSVFCTAVTLCKKYLYLQSNNINWNYIRKVSTNKRKDICKLQTYVLPASENPTTLLKYSVHTTQRVLHITSCLHIVHEIPVHTPQCVD
jgi:hypothetical protein